MDYGFVYTLFSIYLEKIFERRLARWLKRKGPLKML